ncbi:cytochrome c biogenesis protein ResB [Gemmatimonadota bacterium]
MSIKEQDRGKSRGPVDLFWELMDSMKSAVTLLIVLTLVSLVGVLLPQFLPNGFAGTMQELYIDKYGPVIGNLLVFCGLDHVFTVWWYYLLLLLLCLNILVCSFRRLNGIINLIRRESYFDNEEKFREQRNNRSAKLEESVGEASGRIESLLKKQGYRVSSNKRGANTVLYAKRGQLSQLGPFLTHISMVLIILGAAISYMLSFEHFQWMAADEVIEVPNMSHMGSPSFQARLIGRRLAGVFGVETETTPLMMTDRVIRNRDWRALPDDLPVGTLMKVRLEKFEAQFTPEGKPKAYLSTVTVLDSDDGDKELFSHLIKVNDPLIHKGVYFYQSSYSPGGGGAQMIDLRVASGDSTGQSPVTVRVKPGGPAVALGNGPDSLRVEQFTGSFRIGEQGQVSSMPGGEDTNPAAQVVLIRGGEEMSKSWVFKNFPNFSHQAGGPYQVTMLDYEKSYLTGLTIRTHRSQTVIWLGFTLMVLGVMLSFYVNHRQFWVMVAPHEQGSRIWIAGASYKWKQPFRQEFKKLCELASGKAAGDKA